MDIFGPLNIFLPKIFLLLFSVSYKEEDPSRNDGKQTSCPASPEKEDPSATAATSALYSAGPVVSDLHLF